ncbi:MBL fold metallo-hydrolase [uncultured Oxalicibacterium sp.]|uniref:MBL fold metallo-hydrolase n=1 Tax=uncultured Oxalicibacterium sp. TaxID=1168540 RepID=UPI0025FB1746|nr:MBL fold metallo-hydrolase [uncultured Oxalicibacterium sp.]
MKFASLGSGSEGNALLLSAGSGTTQSFVMLDCGFTVRETERRLAKRGVVPEQLSAIVVTHEHHDHVGGVFKFARRHRIPVWMSCGTHRAVADRCEDVELHFCGDGDVVEIGDLCLRPYTVPHDANEPIQYVATDGARKLGVLTDAGHGTAHMIAALDGCDALLLECNHDVHMLQTSAYPSFLKQRIAGDYGHLSNTAAAEILASLDRSRLQQVIAAHLSSTNNTPALAHAALNAVVGQSALIEIAGQQEGFNWIEIA